MVFTASQLLLWLYVVPCLFNGFMYWLLERYWIIDPHLTPPRRSALRNRIKRPVMWQLFIPAVHLYFTALFVLLIAYGLVLVIRAFTSDDPDGQDYFD